MTIHNYNGNDNDNKLTLFRHIFYRESNLFTYIFNNISNQNLYMSRRLYSRHHIAAIAPVKC